MMLLWVVRDEDQLGGDAVNNLWIHREDCQLLLLWIMISLEGMELSAWWGCCQ
jgi:hypothetical protein